MARDRRDRTSDRQLDDLIDDLFADDFNNDRDFNKQAPDLSRKAGNN